MSNKTTPNGTTGKGVKVAVVQAAPVVLNREATLEKMAKICQEAGCNGAGAELILFPEAFVSWYPRGNNFGVVIGSRTLEGRELYRRYFESSVEVPGPAVDAMSAMAKENKVQLVVGVIEREDGTLYCTILFFDDTGAYLGKHRKLMPTAAERLVWGFGDGSTLPVFDTKVGKVGGVICWENYMPALRLTMYSKGIQIYCAPTADSRDTWLHSMKHIAFEGRCFVLTCNQYIKKSDYPPNIPQDFTQFGSSDDPVVCRGGSCIINPYGEVIAGPNYEGETILYAELDLDEILRAKIDFDPVGHYSRPDVFTLYVNEKQNKPVITTNGNNGPDSTSTVANSNTNPFSY